MSLPAELMRLYPEPGAGPRLVVIAGPPGSGKGTQCARLAQLLDAHHLSIGDTLRTEVRRGTTLGRRAADHLAAGTLVPDQLAVDVVTGQLANEPTAGLVLLDGFPRNLTQAHRLDELWPEAIELAIALVVPMGVILRRLSARGRTDDQPEAIWSRLLSYERDTRPVLEHLTSRGLLAHVDGNRAPDEVTMGALTRIRARAA